VPGCTDDAEKEKEEKGGAQLLQHPATERRRFNRIGRYGSEFSGKLKRQGGEKKKNGRDTFLGEEREKKKKKGWLRVRKVHGVGRCGHHWTREGENGP